MKLKIIKLLQNSIHVPSVQVKSLKEGSVAPEGPLDRSESKKVTDSQLGSELEEGISSFDHCFPDGDKANKDTDSVENCVHTCHDGGDDHISRQPFLTIDGHDYYIHPSIETMLQNLCDHIPNQNKQAEHYHVGELSYPHDQNLGGSPTKLEQLTDIVAVDQASKADSLGILEHSPHDEIEGEIVYLQSRLLNDVAAMNQRY
uniref:Uncharacterized protein n=1 Tax=Aegilops tauschii subsp. strangulata TaxID=200361 RepID=A0A453R350_AEGTS